MKNSERRIFELQTGQGDVDSQNGASRSSFAHGSKNEVRFYEELGFRSRAIVSMLSSSSPPGGGGDRRFLRLGDLGETPGLMADRMRRCRSRKPSRITRSLALGVCRW